MLQRVFKAFHYRDFRRMWIGACISSIGTWMQVMAQGMLILNLSDNSAFLLGLDAFLGGIPIFLFSLVGGVIADRIDRRKVLLGSQFVQMGCALLLTTMLILHVVRVWEVLCLSFIVGLAQAFGGPAYQALIPTLVEKEDMPNAIALQSIQFNVARVIGPAVGGLAMTHLGNVWCFGLNGLSFLAPIISLILVKPKFTPQKTTDSILASIKQGISFVRGQSAMEALMVLAFCMTLLGIPMMTFLPFYAKKVIFTDMKPETVLTLFLSASGIGSIVGSLTLAWLGNMKHKGRATLIMLICLGATISGFALSKNVWLSCLMLFLGGISLIAVFALVNSLVQLITTNEMRGRVMSVYNVAFRGGMPMGNLMAGRLVESFTAPVVLAVNGVVLVGVALYFLMVHRRVAAL
ncbi:MAG TPA: MFS transporter [Candidatus Acidoferrum sp.]|nr:MFS transporter [Candidatus Acidoferrum sp.]